MASFAALDRSLSADVGQLHDYLWAGKKLSERDLLQRIERDATRLDRHVRARGAITSAVRPLLRPFAKVPMGPDLYTFLDAVASVSAAVEARRRRPKAAAARASALAVSLSIGLASAANRFDLVESFEGGRTDFGEFTSSLADVLQEKGAFRAGEFRRAVNQSFDLNALWDPHAPRDVQQISALAAITSVGLACVLYVDGIRSMGRYRPVPFAKLVPAVHRILDGLGHHP